MIEQEIRRADFIVSYMLSVSREGCKPYEPAPDRQVLTIFCVNQAFGLRLSSQAVSRAELFRDSPQIG
jgi:hypothetical protein